MFSKIQVLKDGETSYKEFETRQEMYDFILPLFKEPGKYYFDENTKYFNEVATYYKTHDEIYVEARRNSKEYIDYWDFQKDRCTNGLYIVGKRNSWFLPREYYMWLNFMPIFDKVKGKFDFPDIYDTQYHLALYELLAELDWKNAAIVKKRQIASSYYHSAKLINRIWFDEGVVLKMGASDKRYVSLDGTWKYLEEYRNFLNEHTAWYRPMNPGKEMSWAQKIETDDHGRKTTRGLKGTLTAMSFDKSPVVSVGGPTKIFFYEEAGIAPTMAKTFEYIKSSLKMGQIVTGQFIAAGSVGELNQAEPLKKMLLDPDSADIYPVRTDLIDANKTVGMTGLFIPEQWSMPPFIDKYGNSRVKEALQALDKEFEETKRVKSPTAYQLHISQHPRNIKEAFAFREENIFPMLIVDSQKTKISEGEFPYEVVDLEYNMNGDVVTKNTNAVPIDKFPFPMRDEHKEGAIVVWEQPDDNRSNNKYIASIDPVRVGATTTSKSLASIYIYKRGVVKMRTNVLGEEETYLEGDKIVCAWCGRFDDPNKTNEKLLKIVKWYNARCICENNVNSFILYCISKNAQGYLIPCNELMFRKDLSLTPTTSKSQCYGWSNDGSKFKDLILPMLIEFLTEEIAADFDDEGTKTSCTLGINRIPDLMAMEEMSKYNPTLNVDRIIALGALVAYVKIQDANKITIIEREPTNLEKNKDFHKLDKRAFNNIGRSKSYSSKRTYRGFKNLR